MTRIMAIAIITAKIMRTAPKSSSALQMPCICGLDAAGDARTMWSS